jgi:hypothetical protein
MDMATRSRQGVGNFFNYIKELRADADEALANSRSVKLAQAKNAVLGAKCGLGCLEDLINILDGLPEGQREWAIECLWHGMQAVFMIGTYCSKMPGGGIEARAERDQTEYARWCRPENKRNELIDAAIAEVPLKGGRRQIKGGPPTVTLIKNPGSCSRQPRTPEYQSRANCHTLSDIVDISCASEPWYWSPG